MAIADTKPLRKPLTLNLVAAGYLGVMVLNIVQIYSQGRSIYPHDVLFLVLFPVAAYGIFKVRRWGWYLVIGHTLSLLIINVVLTVKFGYFFDQLFIQFNLLLLFFLWFFFTQEREIPVSQSGAALVGTTTQPLRCNVSGHSTQRIGRCGHG
jgi:hypothetical protein